MVRSIRLKFGSANIPNLVLPPATLTLFVGPNGSGKSLALREIRDYADAGPKPEGNLILDRLCVRVPDETTTLSMLGPRRYTRSDVMAGHIRLVKQSPGSSANHREVSESGFELQMRDARQKQASGNEVFSPPFIFEHFFSLFTVALDGKTRFGLIDERPSGDLLGTPQNHLAALFQDDAARAQVRDIVREAFGSYFVIDPTDVGKLRIRMSARPPADPAEEQALDSRARAFHAAARDIKVMSDGVKAYTGIISALASADFRIIVIDEPEAFLHPPLARKLGNQMATLASGRDATVFAATHSADFLMGAVESGKPLNVVRLTHQAGTPAARLLSASKVRELMRDPLLRSTNVLSALFHVGAVVCEADADRCFYQEINSRLDACGEEAAKDTVFLNAQNKQTVQRIVGPLRTMGIAAAAVVDFDIIKGRDLSALLTACGVPQTLRHSLTVLRGDLEAIFKTRDLDMNTGGISLLHGSEMASCRKLLHDLAEYGIFVLPNGELESWLREWNVSDRKNDWLARVFERMGSDPDDSFYVRPEANDVWGFVRQVARWINSPQRMGMDATAADTGPAPVVSDT